MSSTMKEGAWVTLVRDRPAKTKVIYKVVARDGDDEFVIAPMDGKRLEMSKGLYVRPHEVDLYMEADDLEPDDRPPVPEFNTNRPYQPEDPVVSVAITAGLVVTGLVKAYRWWKHERFTEGI